MRTKTTLIKREEAKDMEFSPPSRFYFVNAFGDFVFIHKGKREKAQEWLDENYGRGKYNIRLAKFVGKQRK